MIIRKAMYGCGLYFFIQLAYNSPILCKFAAIIINTINKHDCFYETILLCHNGDGNVLHCIAGSEQI